MGLPSCVASCHTRDLLVMSCDRSSKGILFRRINKTASLTRSTSPAQGSDMSSEIDLLVGDVLQWGSDGLFPPKHLGRPEAVHMTTMCEALNSCGSRVPLDSRTDLGREAIKLPALPSVHCHSSSEERGCASSCGNVDVWSEEKQWSCWQKNSQT